MSYCIDLCLVVPSSIVCRRLHSPLYRTLVLLRIVPPSMQIFVTIAVLVDEIVLSFLYVIVAVLLPPPSGQCR